MSRNFTLEEFAAESEKRFGSLVINDITFRPVLRLSKEEREEFKDASQALDDLHKAAALFQERKEIEAENVERAKNDEELLPVPDAPEITTDDIRAKTIAVLGVTTKNKAEWAAWSETLDEADLYTILGLYGEDTQVGEA